MPRHPRVQSPGAVYHTTARGNRRQLIFEDDRDRARFMDFVARVIGIHSWTCLGYCLMPNHYHLVVQAPHADLSRGMHRLNSAYAHWFNSRHGVDGHLFQGRFHAVLVDSQFHLLELSRYLGLNPVRTALCAHPADWAWSSYSPTIGASIPPSFLAVDRILSHFGSQPTKAREAFQRFVAEGL
jgi:REP-associated tyrosine transposase